MAKLEYTIYVRELEPVKEFAKAVWDIREWLAWHATPKMPTEWLRGTGEPDVSMEQIRKVVNMMSGWNFGDEEGARALNEVAS